ncbi:MAG: hypothetical protein LBP68_03430, partial [Acidobacteriota bacterium]|nr:hypothetical protein [Acidobacteriota bacterium]
MGFIVFVIILVLFILVVNLHQKANRLERRINDLAAQLQRERNETPIPIPKRAPVPPVAPPIQAPPR